MLANPSVTLDADSGTGSVDLGGTLNVVGDAVQGIVTSVAGADVTVTATDASTSAKGVAKFAAADFAVTAGEVTIKDAGVGNSQLEHSVVTVAGTTGSDDVALGETLTVVGGIAEVTTAVTANQIAVSVGTATVTTKGIASFADADFTVTNGAVTIDAKSLDWLTDVAITSPAAGETLVYNGTNFVNRPAFYVYSAGAAATSHTVTHGLGQKYVNVTIVDDADEVVIPQSIVYNSTTQLTVTFNTALQAKVIVSGLNLGA